MSLKWGLKGAARHVVDVNPNAVDLIRSGKTAMGFLIREVMILTENEYHPRDVRAEINALMARNEPVDDNSCDQALPNKSG